MIWKLNMNVPLSNLVHAQSQMVHMTTTIFAVHIDTIQAIRRKPINDLFNSFAELPDTRTGADGI